MSSRSVWLFLQVVGDILVQQILWSCDFSWISVLVPICYEACFFWSGDLGFATDWPIRKETLAVSLEKGDL